MSHAPRSPACWTLLRPVCLLLAVSAWGCAEPAPRNVLLITLDTTRADRLGAYGFGPARTPNVDRLAAEGVLVEDAIAVTPITLPSHASMLTGLYPPAHGVRDNGAYRLGDEAVTLPELLLERGFRTQAFVSARVLDSIYGLDQGFQGYDDELWEEDDPALFMIRDRPAYRTAARAVEWLDQWEEDGKDPFFLWVHFFDPHHPWKANPTDRILSFSPYDAEIAQADRGVGALLDRLEAAGALDETLVVLTADHGESLGEHGEQTHAVFIYDATVRIPLVLRGPGLPRGKTYDGPVRQVDLMPTVLSALGLPVPARIQGVDLWDALRGKARPPQLSQYSESLLSEIGFGMAPLHGVRSDGWKYIRAPRQELYDLRADPNELENVFSSEQRRASRLSRELDRILTESQALAVAAEETPMDQSMMETLSALGYLAPLSDRQSMDGMDPKDGIHLHAKLSHARNHAQAGRWEEAAATAQEVLEELPNNTSARNTLAMALEQMGRIDEAEDQYLQSIGYVPRQPLVYTFLGRLALQEGQLEDAEARLRQALELSPRFTQALIYLGFLETLRGDHAAAAEWYERAMAEDEHHPRLRRLLGDLHYERQEWVEALKHYRRAVELEPSFFPAQVQAGLAAWHAGRPEEGVEHLERAAELRPDAWEPFYNLACLRLAEGSPEQARLALEEALDRGFANVHLLATDPDFATAHGEPWFRELVARLLPEAAAAS